MKIYHLATLPGIVLSYRPIDVLQNPSQRSLKKKDSSLHHDPRQSCKPGADVMIFQYYRQKFSKKLAF
jgi:hypothetical protein